MASIDKAYTADYKEYLALIEWCNGVKIKFGKSTLSDRIYDWAESDFDGNERPVINTSSEMDEYIINNCPLKFMQDRMKEVYSPDAYSLFITKAQVEEK